MGQWEEKLGAILNNPQAMSQIMSIAQSLGGDQPPDQDGQPPAQPQEPQVEPSPPAPAEDAPALDPRVMAAGLRALSVWQGPADPRSAPLQALRPFVREERQAKVDKAIRIVRMSKAVRAALEGLQEGGARADV